MDSHTCPQCGSPKNRGNEICPVCSLVFCIHCGSIKTFHLCPVCDRETISKRQVRLENKLIQAKDHQKDNDSRLRALVYARDVRTERELRRYRNERRFLYRSLFFGCFVSLPLIALGLQMSVYNGIQPLGIITLLAGFIFLGLAIHFRLTYDAARDARKWQRLSHQEKIRIVALSQLEFYPSPSSNQPVMDSTPRQVQ